MARVASLAERLAGAGGLNGPPLPADFYARPTLEVCRAVLGCIVSHTTAAGAVSGIIVEAEAYIGRDDPACHAYGGQTRRNATMWAAPGVAYVYRSYGLHWMLNLVTERADFPAAVLVRAAEPLSGHLLIGQRCPGQSPRDWLVGPGRLTQGLGITGLNDGVHLDQGTLTLRPGLLIADEQVYASERIGITRGREYPWRLYIAGHPSVSARAIKGVAYRPGG